MASPLEQFTNCIIEVKQVSGYVYSPEKHQDIPQQNIIEIKAFLKPTKKLNLGQVGVDIIQTVFEGYLFGYSKLPDGVRFPQECRVKFIDGVAGTIQLNNKISSPYYDEINIFGIPVTGQFKQNV